MSTGRWRCVSSLGADCILKSHTIDGSSGGLASKQARYTKYSTTCRAPYIFVRLLCRGVMNIYVANKRWHINLYKYIDLLSFLGALIDGLSKVPVTHKGLV